jgi:hypothetical protein
MKEIKVREYGLWTSCTYIKWNKETSCDCFNGVGRGLRERDDEGDLINVQYKPVWNCHQNLPCTMNTSL